MVDPRTHNATSSHEGRRPGADAAKGVTSQAQSPPRATATGPHLAAAPGFDEILAKEAVASLRRTRAAAHTEEVKSKGRAMIPPAKLVVRPSKPHPWVTPFISLAVIVAISTSLSAGGLAYLFLRPSAAANTSEAELRSLRDTVAQLRHHIAELSNDTATNRIAIAAANQAASDRFARFAQKLDRLERDRSTQAAKIEREAEENAQVARQPPSDPSSEITGSIQQPPRKTNARRQVIPGWHVRRAYDSVAILEGKAGVIEVTVGQDVPDLGRIQEIKHENGRWRILTSNGVINPFR